MKSGEGHWERHELASNGIKAETESLQGVRSHQRAVVLLSEDDSGDTYAILVFEERSPRLTPDRLPVGQAESLLGQTVYPKSLKNLAWDDRVDSARVDQELDGFDQTRFCWIPYSDFENCQTHTHSLRVLLYRPLRFVFYLLWLRAT